MEGGGDVLLYSGLGLSMVGCVITVVGLGDKGFQTMELQLVGPLVILAGGMVTIISILMCVLGGKREDGRKEEETERKKKGKRSRGRNGNILTTIVNKEGHLQYKIVRQELPLIEDQEEDL